MRRGWEGGELLKRNVAAAAGTAQPVQANKNTTYLYTAGRCFILLDPHRPGWLPWRQGKTPLWGRWSLRTQREWSASHGHAWLLSTQHRPPLPQFCCPNAISPPHILSPCLGTCRSQGLQWHPCHYPCCQPWRSMQETRL